MNGLNNQQIVLLCLLVCFVTSITTAISVASLLEQSPKPVTQTINRVIEKTIERVVDPEGESSEDTKDVRVEKEIVTVVVNSEDLTIDAVAKNSKSIARIFTFPKGQTTEEKVFRGLGAVVSAEGKILTDSANIDQYKLTNDFYVEVSGAGFEVSSVDETSNSFSILLPNAEQDLPDFIPTTFAQTKNVKLAQSVIVIGGEKSNSVSTGIVNDILAVDGESVTESESETKSILAIVSSVDSKNVQNGSLLLNLQGNVIGMYSSSFDMDKTIFVPSDTISNIISQN